MRVQLSDELLRIKAEIEGNNERVRLKSLPSAEELVREVLNG